MNFHVVFTCPARTTSPIQNFRFVHSLQAHGFSPVWINAPFPIELLWENVLSQGEHLNGFTRVWTFMWGLSIVTKQTIFAHFPPFLTSCLTTKCKFKSGQQVKKPDQDSYKPDQQKYALSLHAIGVQFSVLLTCSKMF